MSVIKSSGEPSYPLAGQENTDAFETNVPFAAESPEQSQARADWLSARLMGEMILTITDPNIGLTREQQDHLVDKADDVISDFNEFIGDGLAVDEEPGSSHRHPLLKRLDRAIEATIDTLDDSVSESKQSSLYPDSLYELDGEGLIKLLKERNRELKKRPKSEA